MEASPQVLWPVVAIMLIKQLDAHISIQHQIRCQL